MTEEDEGDFIVVDEADAPEPRPLVGHVFASLAGTAFAPVLYLAPATAGALWFAARGQHLAARAAMFVGAFVVLVAVEVTLFSWLLNLITGTFMAGSIIHRLFRERKRGRAK